MSDNTWKTRFHPLVAGWFESRYTRPTDIQIKGWNSIHRGEHVLITAPTGSEKTLAAFHPVPVEELFNLIRSSYPYRNLSENDFKRVVEMLSGKYSDSRIRELDPRISWDRIDNTLQTLTLRGSSIDSMKRVMEQLLGYPAPASLWEKDILPSRLTPYFTSWMDSFDALRKGIRNSFKGKSVSAHPVSGNWFILPAPKKQKKYRIPCSPGWEHLDRYLEFFNAPLVRDFDPEKSIRIEEINGTPAAESSYAGPLLRFGFVRDYKSLILRKRFQVSYTT